MGFLESLGNAVFGGGSDASAAQMEYYKKIQPMLEGYYNPYIQQGQNAGDKYRQNLDVMMANNGKDFVNDIYNSYQESPAYKFAAGQATTAANNAAAAGGTLGTGAHQAQLADYIQGLSSRDQADYFNRIMGNYNQGMAGYQGIMNQGYNATNALAGGVTQNMQDMGALAAQQEAARQRGAMNVLGMGIGAVTGGLGGLALGGMGSNLIQGADGMSFDAGGEASSPSGWSWKGAAQGIMPWLQ
jgi:hypothetical protein